ncbi:Fe-only nitrogenase accessory AnfO family protein [Faecalicatena contorta]|uniref:Fe-only nitrogenase accessory protein AnfO n=1 Tax=Faecalicatena contorta TaxID=39482 RepID=A0A315ZQH4_9FIRM|nr:Fe-only nitrogenase accessory AnfO family protein [Faecalicatena contorta]PWJ47542.1 Fe-only nitrogenase accessory protein AnfO [Faecalicatena contorta]SUQ15931.1 Fe-only nitrogenase accessory protein AnfO [Faecalicatena contorta]
MERIAVFTDQNGNMVNFYDCVCFQIFLKIKREFILEKTIYYDPIPQSTVSEVRKSVKYLTELLENCKIAAFRDISGIPYTILDREGFLIFLVPDYIKETLNGIVLDLEEMKKEKRMKWELAENIKPLESDIPGIYFFNLLQIEKEHPELSSKQILMEFLQTTSFLELKLRCSHVPPWITRDGAWNVQVQDTEQGILARITARQCQEGSL